MRAPVGGNKHIKSILFKVLSIPTSPAMKTATLFSVLIPSALGSTIYFAGDSTMAKGGGGTSTNGTYKYLYRVAIRADEANTVRMG
jgi:hypothetical protein